MAWQDILKSYELDEFIIIKNKRKKKGSKKEKGSDEFKVKVPGGELTVTQTARIKKLQKDFKTWWSTCEGQTLDDIGIVGAKGNNNLLEFVLDHVDKGVQRPKQEPKKGAMKITKKIMSIVEKEEVYSLQQLKTVQTFIDMLEAVKENSRSNPKNIIFTEQHSKTKKVPVRGHYRTAWYEKKTGKKKVDSDWYDYNVSFDRDDDSSTAEPPLWQALFNGQPELIEKATITGLEKGLLTLLLEFEEEMKNQPIKDIPVIGKEGREAVLQIKGVTQGIQAILSNQESYHSATEPYKRLWLNVANVRKQLNVMEFNIDPNDAAAITAIKRLVPVLEDAASENFEGFKIIQITPGLLRSIIRRMGIDLDTFLHGSEKGIFLHRPWTTKVQNTRKELFNREYKKAKKQGNLPRWAERDEEEDDPSGKGVKKSWQDILKLMPQKIEPMKNPASDLHMPSVFSKERQTQISRENNETCDYCEKDVVLDCRDCKQKLCRDHLNKPCAIRKAVRKPKTPIATAGGKIEIQELRRLIQEIKDDTDVDDDFEKELLIVTIPITYTDGQRRLRTGLFNYDSAKSYFGESYLQRLIESNSGIMGAYFVSQEDLADSPIRYPKLNEFYTFTEEDLEEMIFDED